MTAFKSSYLKWTIIFGALLLLTYLFQDILYKRIWLFSSLFTLLFAIAFILIVVIGLIKKHKEILPVLIIIIIAVITTETLRSELFKSDKVLYAILKDDLSNINLTLRKNKTFEVKVVTILSEQNYKGKYKLLNNRIIFIEKDFYNVFIPDTLSIYNDKIILHFDKENKPITDFATYFDITQNKLKTVHNQ